MRVVAFTDGSCYWKIEKGGWGALIEFPETNTEIEISGGCINTTISRMEMRALHEVLKRMPYESCDLTVYSDSEYVVKAFTENRLFKWITNQWIGVKNTDLWKKIVNEIVERPKLILTLVHVKGHSKEEDYLSVGNMIADDLADYKKHSFYEKDLPEPKRKLPL